MFGLQRICFLWKTLVLGTAVAKPDENVDADGRERLGRALQDAICDHTAYFYSSRLLVPHDF